MRTEFYHPHKEKKYADMGTFEKEMMKINFRVKEENMIKEERAKRIFKNKNSKCKNTFAKFFLCKR